MVGLAGEIVEVLDFPDRTASGAERVGFAGIVVTAPFIPESFAMEISSMSWFWDPRDRLKVLFAICGGTETEMKRFQVED